MNNLLEYNLVYNTTLNKKLFENEKLKKEVLEKLKDIAYTFIEYLEIPDLKIYDVLFVGSNASYNYDKTSDIDLHIIIDYEDIVGNNLDIPPIEVYFNDKKKIFNLEHDIKIYGYNVELYAEDINNVSSSNGKYSVLSDEWVKLPEFEEDLSVDEFNIDKEYKEYVIKINEILTSEFNYELAEKLLNNIYLYRRVGLKKDKKEFSVENLVFKELRKTGYLDKLRNYIKENQNKSLSLT